MIDVSKHLDFFSPAQVDNDIHIVGVGAMGSGIAETLIRLGIDNLHLWDFDTVSPHNLANQVYHHADIGKPKTEALSQYLLSIDPSAKLRLHDKWDGHPLNGYIFLSVDNINIRRQIVESNRYNPHTKAFFDFRMRLSDAQHYAATPDTADNLLKSMDFTQEEAAAATPVSACGTTLSVLPTIRVIIGYGIANMINFIKTGKLKKLILIDAFDFTVDAY